MLIRTLTQVALAICTTFAASVPQLAEPPRQDRVLAAEFIEEFVVGRAAGAEHEMLFGLVDVAFGPDGTLILLEEDAKRVLVYGPDGEFLRAFGREGEGPGEFGLPFSIAVTSGGEIVVWDFIRSSFLLFDNAGTHIRDITRSERRFQPLRDSLEPWPDGGVVYLPTELQRDDDPIEDLDRGAVILEPLATSGDPRALVEVRHPRRRPRRVGRVMMLLQGPEFGPRARWGVLSDGRLAVVDSTAYRVRLVDPDRGVESVIERPMSPRPVTDVERQRVLDEQRASLQGGPRALLQGGGGGGGAGRSISAAEIDEMLEAFEFADVIPAIKDLTVDRADRLWIQRYGDSVFSPEGPIDLVTAVGEYLGTLPPMPLPDAFGPGGLVAWMEVGEDFDFDRIVVRRMTGALLAR